MEFRPNTIEAPKTPIILSDAEARTVIGLITAQDLQSWANRLDCQSTLRELVRRLIHPENEIDCASRLQRRFWIYGLFCFGTDTKLCRMNGPWGEVFHLRPKVFHAVPQ